MANKEKLQRKMLRDVANILEKHEIPYWLDSGTLLGMIREKNHLSWHNNVDIAIKGEDLNRLLSLWKAFAPKYRFKKFKNASGREWIEGNVTRVRIIRSWEKLSETDFKIIVVIKFKVDDKYRWIDNRSCKWVNSHFFDRLDEINIEGRKYPIPSDVENYLQQRYGDWKIPQRYWFSRIDDPSIVPDDIIKKIPKRPLVSLTNPWHSRVKEIQLKGDYLFRMKKMLFDILDILERNDIKYWLDDGTLLGIIRDGDLIPWDHDVDIGISGESVPIILNNWYKFLPKYLLRKRTVDDVWLPDIIRAFKIGTIWEKIIHVNFHIDLFAKYKVENAYHWIDCGELKQLETKYYDTLDTIDWEGRKVHIPHDVEAYLGIRYGNWRIPDRNFEPSLDDGAIAERGF